MRIVCDATLAFIKRWNVLSAIIKIADFREERACIKFCFKLGKTATECHEMLKTAFGKQAICLSQTFQCFSLFKAGRTSIDDDERSGRPVYSSRLQEPITCTLSGSKSIHSTPCQKIFKKSILMLSSHLRLGFSKWSLSLRFPYQNLVYIFPVPHTCHMPHSSHSS